MTAASAYCWAATAICMAGTAINVKRGNACFWFWAVGEVMWLSLDVWQGLWSRAMLDFLGLAFAVWGAWENMLKDKCKRRSRR